MRQRAILSYLLGVIRYGRGICTPLYLRTMLYENRGVELSEEQVAEMVVPVASARGILCLSRAASRALLFLYEGRQRLIFT